ncbi:MAG: ABC transporter permease [Syntrophomonadaceae bacterium]|nr:ABC transporter permease [Syntrophomonadaceae bacterium]
MYQVYMDKIIMPAFFTTLKMLAISIALGTILGFLLAMVLTLTDEKGLYPQKWVYGILDFIVNTIRSFPFIILMVAIVPFTRLIAGTSIGERAAIVPLTIVAAPFIARVIDNSMKEVDRQLIEAARSFGASNLQIIFRVILVEAVPSIISGLTLASVSVLSATAMAGAIGAGGLGAVALTYGYQNFNNEIMFITVVMLIVLVQIIQVSGDMIYRRLK